MVTGVRIPRSEDRTSGTARDGRFEMCPQGRAGPFWPGSLATAVVVGAIVAIKSTIAVAILALFGALGIVHLRAWRFVAAGLLLGLMLLTYGFHSIPVSIIGLGAVPLPDVLLAFCLAASAPVWWEAMRTGLRQRWLLLYAALIIFVLARLTVDIPKSGVAAVRDAVFVFEVSAFLVGIALSRYWYGETLTAGLNRLFYVISAWYLLIPFGGLLAKISPVVGLDGAVPLITFTGSDFFAAIAFFWFLRGRGVTDAIWAGFALFAVLFRQGRITYLAVAFTYVLWMLPSIRVRGGAAVRRRAIVLGAVALISLTVALAVVPHSTGRVGQEVGLATVGRQLNTLVSREGVGSGSINDRLDWWSATVERTTSTALGPVVGIGLGEDLARGFTIVAGVQIRKPHNDYLETWARLGAVGLALWVVLIAIAVRMALHVNHPSLSRWPIALCAIPLVIAAAQPFFAFSYGGIPYWMLLGVLAGNGDAARAQQS